jgi:dTDP-4-amino-4,6-dideoxygalactose transaminase
MDEIRAAYGILALRKVDESIQARRNVAIRYREGLKDIPGISYFEDMPGVKHNYSYFPIFVDSKEYGMTRDELYYKLQEYGIIGRRYFYPLISTFSTYCGLESANPLNLPVATRMADSVICLPMHHELTIEEIDRAINIIKR